MTYKNDDFYCDYCGKKVDPENKHAVFSRNDQVFCDVGCEENSEADRAAAQADRAQEAGR